MSNCMLGFNQPFPFMAGPESGSGNGGPADQHVATATDLHLV